MNAPALRLSGSEPADALLSSDALALLIGLVLDQQVPMEKAFVGPHVMVERLGHALDAAELSAADPDEFAVMFATPPAVHRFPAAMAKRVQAMCGLLCETYDGRAENVWAGVTDGATLLRRLKTLPGFGDQKARITVALLGKQLGVKPTGWRKAAGEYGEPDVFRSIADITDEDSLRRVRQFKQERKAAARK
ncbi:MAG TPA: HhH-GPD-type base excision DNA repair protein [Mycobacteriales bacterium]|nr:HhH-GPD-type base excision DNA repair protein [Mycobacteriales bacterium]